MGGKVNLYLDDESLDIWHSIPSGQRSQIVRDALKSVDFSGKNREERSILEKQFRDLLVSKGKDAGGIAAKFRSGNYREMKVNVGKGLWMTYAQRLNYTKIELYIYRFGAQPRHWRRGTYREQNSNLIRIFADYEDEVEEYFGAGLYWDDPDEWGEQKACRIGKKYKEFNLHDSKCWDSIASEMVRDMNRLDGALRPIYKKLQGLTIYEYDWKVRHGGVDVHSSEWEDADIGNG